MCALLRAPALRLFEAMVIKSNHHAQIVPDNLVSHSASSPKSLSLLNKTAAICGGFDGA